MPSPAGLASSPMAEARAWLDQALARIDELSVADRDRLVYLEERSSESREAAEDLFHTANNALFVMEVEIELLTGHLKGECEHKEVKGWLRVLTEKVQEIKTVNRRLFASDSEEPIYSIHSFVSFRAVIQRALQIYEDVARKKRIRISWTLPDFPAVAIWSDAVAIGTVLDNLLSNAIKFSEPGKGVDVSMRRERTDLICAVCDEGPGLSKKDLAKVFQRGVRLGPKPTGGESSSGYGLATARNLVNKLGGRIWCESVEGKGTCFMFSLPAQERRKRARKSTSIKDA
jgi:signal transduction histidine kinase